MTSREEDGATLRLLETTSRSQERPRRSVRRTLRQPKRGRATVGEVLGVPFFWQKSDEAGAHHGASKTDTDIDPQQSLQGERVWGAGVADTGGRLFALERRIACRPGAPPGEAASSKRTAGVSLQSESHESVVALCL